MYKENGYIYLSDKESKRWDNIHKALSKSSISVFHLKHSDIRLLHRICKAYDKNMIYDEWGKRDDATDAQINVSLYNKIHDKVKVDKYACKHHFGALAKVAALWVLLCAGYVALRLLS